MSTATLGPRAYTVASRAAESCVVPYIAAGLRVQHRQIYPFGYRYASSHQYGQYPDRQRGGSAKSGNAFHQGLWRPRSGKLLPGEI